MQKQPLSVMLNEAQHTTLHLPPAPPAKLQRFNVHSDHFRILKGRISEKISFIAVNRNHPIATWLDIALAEPSLMHYGETDFLAHVLIEMTRHGFNDETIYRSKQDLHEMLREAEESRAAGLTYTIEEVWEKPGIGEHDSDELSDPAADRRIILENEAAESRMLGIRIYYDRRKSSNHSGD